MIVCLISISVNAIQISYEDITYSHSLRCCNATHCVNLHYINDENFTYRYTQLNPDYCYEIGGFEKQDYPSLLIMYIAIITFIGLILIFIRRLIKRENKIE